MPAPGTLEHLESGGADHRAGVVGDQLDHVRRHPGQTPRPRIQRWIRRLQRAGVGRAFRKQRVQAGGIRRLGVADADARAHPRVVRARISSSSARVTGSATATGSPCTAGSSSPAMRLPSSTPHWSKALMPHSTDCA